MADIFIICNGNNSWKAWMGLILFSAGTIVFMFRLYSEQPELVIDVVGVKGKNTQNKLVKWDILTDAYLHRANSQTLICLTVKESENKYKDSTSFEKDLLEFNKLFLGVQEINLNLGLLRCDKQ